MQHSTLKDSHLAALRTPGLMHLTTRSTFVLAASLRPLPLAATCSLYLRAWLLFALFFLDSTYKGDFRVFVLLSDLFHLALSPHVVTDDKIFFVL